MLSLETERLHLRPCTSNDDNTLYEVYWGIASDYDPHQPPLTQPPTPQDIREENAYYLGAHQHRFMKPFGRWLIWRKPDLTGDEATPIGTAMLWPWLFSPAEVLSTDAGDGRGPQLSAWEVMIGWALVRPQRQQGFATEAARALLQYGFDTVKLRRIASFTAPDNHASLNVMRKLGLRVVSQPGAPEVLTLIENIPL